MFSDLRPIPLPSGSKFIHENNKVRIAHRDWDSADLAKCDFDRELVANLRLAHRGLKLKEHVSVRGQSACLDSSPGAHANFLARIFRTQVGSDASRTVAGDFRL